MTTTKPSIEQQLLELVAKKTAFPYLMYVPESPPHPSGLLHQGGPKGRAAVWNPLTTDGDLFQLAIAVPAIDIHKFILQAATASDDKAIQRKLVRENFVRAVAELAQQKDAPANEPATAETAT